MRVASVISTLDRCGPVNVLYDLVHHHQQGAGNESVIFTLAAEPWGSRRADFEALGAAVHCVADNRLAATVRGRPRLARALGRVRPDVVHAHGFRAYRMCRDVDLPTVATVHNNLYEDYSLAYGKLMGWWMTRTEVRDLRRFSAVVACSRANAEALARRYAMDPQWIRNGVDHARYAPLPPARRAELRRSLGHGETTTVLVATGGCSERKNTQALIRAFERASQGGGVELHILGTGPTYEACRRLNAPGVVLHGFVDNVIDHLQAADLFVSASRAEGMPLAVLEALSCGLPAVLSSIPPHEELAEMLSGQDCIATFDGAAPGAMTRSLSEVLTAMRDGSGDALRPPADARELSSTRMGQDYEALYRLVAGRGGRA